jgi:hypothetical protein
MFTKTSIALAIIVAITSGALAAPKHLSAQPQITMPSSTPEGNRDGWFMAW